MTYTRIVATTLAFALIISQAQAADQLRVYGAGGPAPAMKDAAEAFQKKTGAKVDVIAGPTPDWMEAAKQNADIIFSGSENMMTGFIKAMNGQIVESSIEPLFMRPSTILVRKGNPKGITGIRDLAKQGFKILAVEGAGQVGLWEDVAGRTGDLPLLVSIRRNIATVADSSASAKKIWIDRPEIDAWIIWNIWQISNNELADAVEVEPELRIWRPSDVSLTKRGAENPIAIDFIAYLKSPAGKEIFKKWGWTG